MSGTAVCWLTGPLGQPGPHHGNGARSKRRDPLLSTFAGAADMRTGSEMDVGAVQPDQFGGPRAGLDGEPAIAVGQPASQT